MIDIKPGQLYAAYDLIRDGWAIFLKGEVWSKEIAGLFSRKELDLAIGIQQKPVKVLEG